MWRYFLAYAYYDTVSWVLLYTYSVTSPKYLYQLSTVYQYTPINMDVKSNDRKSTLLNSYWSVILEDDN